MPWRRSSPVPDGARRGSSPELKRANADHEPACRDLGTILPDRQLGDSIAAVSANFVASTPIADEPEERLLADLGWARF